MVYLLVSFFCAAGSAALSVTNRAVRILGKFLGAAAAVFLIVPALRVLLTGVAIRIDDPGMSWTGLEMDPLAALFALVLGLVYFLYAIPQILPVSGGKKSSRSASADWTPPVFLVFSAALLLVHNGIALVILAEAAALTMTWWRRKNYPGAGGLARFAGFLQFGIVPIAAAVAVLISQSRSPDIRSFAAVLSAQGPATHLASLLIFIGSGAILGLFPFHGWLEDRVASDTGDKVLFPALWPVLGLALFSRLLFGWKSPLLSAVLFVIALGAVTLIWSSVMSTRKKNNGSLVFGLDMAQGGLMALGLGAGMLGGMTGDPFASVLGYFGAALTAVNRAASSLVIGGSAAIIGTKKGEGLSRSIAFAIPMAGFAGIPVTLGGIGWFVIYTAYFVLAAGTWPVAAISWGALAVLAVSQSVLVGAIRDPLRTIFRDPARIRGRWMMKISAGLGLVLLVLPAMVPQFASLVLVNPVFAFSGLEPVVPGTLTQITSSRLFVMLNTLSRFLLAFTGTVLMLYFIRLFVLVKREYDRDDGAV